MEIQSNSCLKQLQIMFSALFCGQALFAIILYFFIKIPVQELDETLTTILPLVIIGIVVSAYTIFNMRLKTLATVDDTENKKAQYRAISIVKWAMFEGATILSLVLYLVFGTTLLLYIGVALIVHFALHFPSRERVLREIQIDNLD